MKQCSTLQPVPVRRFNFPVVGILSSLVLGPSCRANTKKSSLISEEIYKEIKEDGTKI